MGILSSRRRGAALVAALAVCSLNASAAAHDPGKVVWSGVYVGGGIGAASAEAGWIFSSGFSPDPNPLDLDTVLAGGFHLGIQRQWGHFVAGLEVSALFTDLDGSSLCPSGIHSCDLDISRIFMVGPRFGFAAHNLHIFGTGGYALGTSDSRTVEIASGLRFDATADRHGGWYLGGGVEWSLGRAMVFGVEYRRIELDDERHISSFGDPNGDRRVDATIDSVMARLTFKVGEMFHGGR